MESNDDFRDVRRAARIRGAGRELSDSANLFQIESESDRPPSSDQWLSEPISAGQNRQEPASTLFDEPALFEVPGPFDEPAPFEETVPFENAADSYAETPVWHNEAPASSKVSHRRKKTPQRITAAVPQNENYDEYHDSSSLNEARPHEAGLNESRIIRESPLHNQQKQQQQLLSQTRRNDKRRDKAILLTGAGSENLPVPRKRGRPPGSKRRRVSEMPYRDQDDLEPSRAVMIEMDRIRIPGADVLPLHQLDVVSMFYKELIDGQIETLEDNLESRSRLERARLVLDSLSEEIHARLLTIIDHLSQRQSLSSSIKRTSSEIARLRAELVHIREERAELLLEESKIRRGVRQRDERAKALRIIGKWSEQQREAPRNDVADKLYTRIQKIAPLLGEEPAGILGRITQLNEALKTVLKAV